MSWYPSIWIKRSDYELLLNELTEFHPNHKAWEFDIGKRGVVLCGSEETSQPNRELHDVLVRMNIDHWIIDGEGAECDECKTWGERLA